MARNYHQRLAFAKRFGFTHQEAKLIEKAFNLHNDNYAECLALAAGAPLDPITDEAQHTINFLLGDRWSPAPGVDPDDEAAVIAAHEAEVKEAYPLIAAATARDIQVAIGKVSF